ncbi:hypothetical protein CLOM_g40005 [Closterium sp. NIES-68]|nr:hypothetical protein CLOM_g40005 [Closterium sp. NIES-68]
MESLMGTHLIFGQQNLLQLKQLQAAATALSASQYLPVDMNLLLQLHNLSGIQNDVPLPSLASDARPRLTWTDKEDCMLKELIRQHGTNKWALVASKIRTKTNKQCRRRWQAFLNAMGNKGVWTPEEDQKLLEGHRLYGNRWTEIARMVPGRTDNAAKNRFAALTAKRGGALSPAQAKSHSDSDVSENGSASQVGDSSSMLSDRPAMKRSRSSEFQLMDRAVKPKVELDLNSVPMAAAAVGSQTSSACSEVEQCLEGSFLPDLNSPVPELTLSL